MLGNKQKTALVIGSSCKTGQAICRQLENSGFSIIPWTSKDCDVTSMQAVEKAVENLTVSKLDALVYVSGIFTVSLQENLQEKDWDRVFDVNIKGLWLVLKSLLKTNKLTNDSSITALSSINAVHGGFGGTACYDASKGAVSAYVISLAKELAPIRVNAVAPGLIQDPALEQSPLKALYEKRALLGTLVSPQDVAEAVNYLVNAKAVTAQILTVDCGYLAN